MRFVLASTACAFFSNVFLSLYWYHYVYGSSFLHLHQEQAVPRHSSLSPEAYPVYGIRADFQNESTVVYAIPNSNDSPPKGIVVLLHACTHNALKFFAPSSTCPDCIGLSEEMRLARIVLERGYLALAVTASSNGGCWGGDKDINAIKTALKGLKENMGIGTTVYALGASSGGSMAAKLVAEGVAVSAGVMVMGLRDQLLDTILALQDGNKKLYLAPMTRDKGTTQRVRDNQAHWKEKKQQLHQKEQQAHEMIVDEVSCVPLPMTANYLWNRVPGMTYDAAKTIVNVLLKHKHLDPKTMKLIVDPTRSNWRDFFLKENEVPVPATFRKSIINNNDDPKSILLWGTFDLTPGISPLAKALHRAWAMHEYCSEIVEHALDFFEGQKTRDEILGILQKQQIE